jgi:hypothetical protein
MNWILILMGAYVIVAVPEPYAAYDVCEAAGKAAVVARNTKIVAYVCVPHE